MARCSLNSSAKGRRSVGLEVPGDVQGLFAIDHQSAGGDVAQAFEVGMLQATDGAEKVTEGQHVDKPQQVAQQRCRPADRVPSSCTTRRPITCLPGERPWLSTSNSTMYHQLSGTTAANPGPCRVAKQGHGTRRIPMTTPRMPRSMANASAPSGRPGAGQVDALRGLDWIAGIDGAGGIAILGSAERLGDTDASSVGDGSNLSRFCWMFVQSTGRWPWRCSAPRLCRSSVQE
jgi:hypothetical protein